MTLGFTTKFPDKTPTLFKEKILSAVDPGIRQQYPDLLPKIHTFRGTERWKAGMKMHMVTGNRTKHRQQFNIGYPELEYCNGTQACTITCQVSVKPYPRILIDDRLLGLDETLLFVANDGFTSLDQFWAWFCWPGMDVSHSGQLIHFSDFRY